MRRVLLASLLFAVWAAQVPAAAAFDPLQSARRAAARGQRALAEGDTTTAIREFMRAQALAPEDEEIRMGLGETLYRASDYPSAQRQFESIASERPREWGRPALYNAGNAAFEAGDYQKALDLYTQAVLEEDSTPGEDLIHNLELAQRMLEQQQQQQDQQQDDQSGDQSESSDQQQESSSDQQQDQQDQQQQQQQQDQQDQQNPEQGQEQQPQPEPQEGEEQPPEESARQQAQMTPEEAMRLLQALDADEEELRKSIQRRLQGEETEAEHDW